MPIYRLYGCDGSQRQIQATRVVTDGAHVRFETWADNAWQPVAAVAVAHGAGLQRRVNNLNGSWGWIRAGPEPLPGHPPRP